MDNTTMNDFRLKRDEMLRQAENHRLIREAQKAHSPASRVVKTLRKAISYFLSI